MTRTPSPAEPLLFGIYPGGATGDDSGGLAVGPPDDPARVSAALDLLQGAPDRPFLVRAYTHFDDTTRLGGPHPTATPAGAERYGPVARTLQVTEEPDVTTNPVLDGYYPGVREAVVRGVPAAAARARELGHTHLRIGFNTTPLFGPATAFVAELTALGGTEFTDALDYVGLDFFPDVFRPVTAAGLAPAVAGLLRHHREAVLTPAGLGHLPLHLTEHGWPTGPERHPDRQAEVVETVVTAVAELAGPLRLSGYTHFALRDADSSRPGLFHRFGLTTDDYTPKPAFDVLRTLVARHGS
ncbi:Hypothetical protein B590_19904 [Streptomyces sp. PVA_94-07]|uniref:hypothetical protein n=1 Tax=Streptomyces sp. PVA_94-07 TaxID=1225337 RepID=UPI0003C2FB05|nr:hypothetical protein [Streptomyces sp. PVA_94-07]ESQ04533.1 Hypothetical protein B590_19904 [Streptomyces sp. PVA_94-07]